MIKKFFFKISSKLSYLFILSLVGVSFCLGAFFMMMHVVVNGSLFFEICSYSCLVYMFFMTVILSVKIDEENKKQIKEQNEFFQKLKEYLDKHRELELFIKGCNEEMCESNDLYNKIIYFVGKEKLIRFYVSQEFDDKFALTLKLSNGDVIQKVNCSKEEIVRNFILNI